MAPISKIQLAGLAQTAQGQEQAIDNVAADLNRVVQECEALGSAFQGEAAKLFQDAMGVYQEGANKVLGSLREMHARMVSTHGMFSSTHEAIGAVAQGTCNSVGGLQGL